MSNSIVTLEQPIRIEPRDEHVHLRVKVQIAHRGKLINELSKDLTERVYDALVEEQIKRAPDIPIDYTKRTVREALRNFFKESTVDQLEGTVEAYLWNLVRHESDGEADGEYWHCLVAAVAAANKMDAFTLLDRAYTNMWRNFIHGAPETCVFMIDSQTASICFRTLVPMERIAEEAMVFSSEKELDQQQRQLRQSMSRPLGGKPTIH